MKNLNKMKIAPDMQYEIGQDKVGYFPEWSVKDDATLWQKVNKLAHSTFDRSKFTVVGSPTITDDGIAYGFTLANGITCPFTMSSANSNRITFRVNPRVATSNTQIIGCLKFNGNMRINIYKEANNGYIRTVTRLNSVNTYDTISTSSGWQDITIEIDSQNVKIIGKTGTMIRATSDFDTGDITFGFTTTTQSYTAFDGQVDLKTFNFTENNVPVFSGNKTGIDTIKPDDFTTFTKIYAHSDGTHTIYADHNTTPTKLFNQDGSNYTGSDFTISENVVYHGENACEYTESSNVTLTLNNATCDAGVKISADGVVTNLSSYNRYVYKTIGSVSDGVLKVRTHITTGSTAPSFNTCMCGIFGNNAKNKVGFDWTTTGSGGFEVIVYHDNTNHHKPFTINPYNQDLDVEIVVDYTATKTTINLYNNNSLIESKSVDYVPVLGTETKAGATGLGWLAGTVPYSFDLNKFKVYKGNDFIYQSCLKIPYTEGQNYVKVVDKLYRDRVKDLFEQKGYNGYYTIGEDDFTLPSNKWSDVIEHKENGLTVAEQRVDQTLTIRGACEQGVDVNLPMEFFSADSYAVFGVGTTGTNTASKFTPAADGNYIAIGKGKV